MRMVRRQQLIVFLTVVVAGILVTAFILPFRNSASGTRHPDYDRSPALVVQEDVGEGVLHGTATAAKIENATLKAELGNAAWKLLHTTMAKFPDKPTDDDQSALKSYIYLFARLYPCGDCARHFQQILSKFPPQTVTRSAAAAWACHVHNEVNKSLKKELFDCSNIGDFYDCGCAEDGEGDKKRPKEHFTALELEKEGLTRGG